MKLLGNGLQNAQRSVGLPADVGSLPAVNLIWVSTVLGQYWNSIENSTDTVLTQYCYSTENSTENSPEKQYWYSTENNTENSTGTVLGQYWDSTGQQ